ncbi:FtsX-like permease family protein [Olsenella sp. SW781]|uniref:FtsX-like permease family protein n=1 Tax=Olsenella sp. SW781 TaxID=2530046 RepID=UPI00336C173F
MAARGGISTAFSKDVLRTVRGSLKRFVALATITALGVTMLVGLRAACLDLRNSADAFFDEQGLFDVRVQSTLGLTDEDVDALSRLDGVGAVEGGYVETCYTTVGATSEKVDVKALSASGMNEPLVLEGRLPESAGEVAVTARYLKDSGLSVGDTVSFHGADDGEEPSEDESALDSGSTEVFERGDYTIVGSVLDPMEINAGEGTMSFRSSGGSQYSFFVTEGGVVDPSVYTVAYVMVDGAAEPLCYSAEYEGIVDEVLQSVEDARAERERARGEQVRSDATEEVDDAEAEALEELADAEQELIDGQAELDEGRAEVADGQRELDEQRADALAQLEDAQDTIDESRRALEEGAAEYEDGLAAYEEGLAAYEAALPGAEQQLRDGQAQLDAARANISGVEVAEGVTIGDLEAQRDQAQAAVDTLPGTIASIDATAEGVASGLDQISEALKGLLGMDFGIGELATQARDAWAAVVAVDPNDEAAVNSAVGGYAEVLSRASKTLSTFSGLLGAQIDQLSEKIAGLNGQIEELGRAIEENEGELADLTDRIEELQESDPESSDLEGLLNQKLELEGTLEGQRKDLEDLEGQRDGLQVQLDSYAGYQTSLDQLISFGSDESADGQGATALASGRVQAQAGLAQAQAGLDQLNPAIEQARGAVEAELATQQAAIDRGWQELRDAYGELEGARVLLAQSAGQIADGRAQLAEGQAELDRQRADALAQLADAQRQLDDALAEIADGQAELDEGRATFEQERDDALAEIADAREEIADLPDATWYVQDRSSLSSYASVESDASSIEAIGTVIPIVFFVVAVLISLTTMTRMVDEERGLIGVYKALGYGRGSILSKYALYALAACLVGGVVGNVLGFVVLPAIIFTIFSTMYALPGFAYGFDAAWALAAFALFAAGIVGATLITCWRELRESPASLMRPKAPRAGSRILLERVGPVWRRLGFLSKVTARNLFRYKRRLLMTVFGIAGCVALLITGFGIRDTVLSLSPRQYGDDGVNRYDLMAVTSADDLDSAVADLEGNPEVEDVLRVYIDSLTVSYGDSKESVSLIVVPDGTDLSGYARLVDESGQPVALPEDGAVITKNAEQVMGFSLGDELHLQDSTLAEGTTSVGGIAMSYLGNTLYMTESAYEAAFGAPCEQNGVLAHLTGDADEQVAFSEGLTEDGRYLSVVSTQKLVNDFSSAFTLINTVVYVVIVLAAALSFTVVFTLSNTNISERERELATIKVLGFRRPEVHRYINKETLILTGIGIVCGMPMGYFLARSLTWILRMPSLYFDVVVDPLTYVISAVLAFVFTLLVNLITDRSLDRIDMVGALKSAE